MKKTIFNVYVVMESQEQCDRMKQLCIDNGLPIWDNEFAFEWMDSEDIFGCNYGKEFYILPHKSCMEYDIEVTEQEFIELLKEYKNV